jgi:WD repeat-containing protein 42A
MVWGVDIFKDSFCFFSFLRLLYVKDGERKIALYSIHMNPLNNNEFCVSGRDNYVRIYDKRRVSGNTQLKKFCPRHLVSL